MKKLLFFIMAVSASIVSCKKEIIVKDSNGNVGVPGFSLALGFDPWLAGDLHNKALDFVLDVEKLHPFKTENEMKDYLKNPKSFDTFSP